MEEERFMRQALALARRAAKRDEAPVGAVVVRGGRIIARGMNRRERRHDPCGHAELIAIRRAARRLGGWRLTGCTLYVTLEPCPMCAGAIINARVPRVVYGAADPRAGAMGSLLDIPAAPLNHRPEVTGGVLAEECGEVLRAYFREKRRKKQ